MRKRKNVRGGFCTALLFSGRLPGIMMVEMVDGGRWNKAPCYCEYQNCKGELGTNLFRGKHQQVEVHLLQIKK